MNDLQPQWRPVHGFETTYQVSSTGLIRRGSTGRPLKPWLAGSGYECVSLSVGGAISKRYVSHLVAFAFLGPRRLGIRKGDWQINHKDGNKRNNRPGNLEFVTTQGNHDHAARCGLTARGERNARARLMESEVIAIRSSSETAKQLRARYGVTLDLIYQIRRRAIWKHVA